MEKLEVLIINDGTPDNSAEMSREYVKRYPETFRQIDKENGGHGSAWNVGLKEATGKYIRFLDSDDWFTDLGHLMRDLENCDADIVLNPYVREMIFENRAETVDVPSVHGIEHIDVKKWEMTTKWGYSVNFWAVTYKSSILKPLLPLFAEKTMYDDYILTWSPLIHGRTYVSYEYPVYHYLIGRPDQSMSITRGRKVAESYVKCFTQYEEVRGRESVDVGSIPSDYMNCIDTFISGYASFIFSYMVYFPYKTARDKMHYLWANYIENTKERSSLMKRYAILPFPVFYCVEHLRRKILHV